MSDDVKRGISCNCFSGPDDKEKETHEPKLKVCPACILAVLLMVGFGVKALVGLF